MDGRTQRRKLVLFLAAVILPCLVLVGLGLRMIGQERELADRRGADERTRLAAAVGQKLLVRLERIKLEEAGAWSRAEPGKLLSRPANSAVALVAKILDGRVVLPTEHPSKSGSQLKEVSFAREFQQGEQAEFAERRFSRAADLYDAAGRHATYPVQQAHARLSLARVLSKSGRTSASDRHFRHLLGLSSEISDELGIPYAYYAARQLLQDPANHDVVLERVEAEFGARYWVNRIAAHMLVDLIDRLIEARPGETSTQLVTDLSRQAHDYVALLKQAAALQNDFSALMLSTRFAGTVLEAASIWLPYGNDPWLVSTTPAPGEPEDLIIAVRADTLLNAFAQEATSEGMVRAEPTFFAGPGEGEALGQNFPGLRVTFKDDDLHALQADSTPRVVFYLLTLMLVLSATLFASYLLWRDVRREGRLAEMRAEFVSSVSHELKTPLTSIRMFAETLAMGRSQDPDTERQYLETIVNESRRLSRLINNVLDFSKIEQGTKNYRPESTVLADVVHAAVEAMAYALKQQGFTLNVEVQEDLPEVFVDGDAIEQAILNLLANAVKYSGESREIDLRLTQKGNQVVIEVEDYGIGIPVSEQARIFDKFYRVSSPDSDRVPGAGLGLAIVAHVADAHDATAEVESVLGEGSTFSLRIPLEGGP